MRSSATRYAIGLVLILPLVQACTWLEREQEPGRSLYTELSISRDGALLSLGGLAQYSELPDGHYYTGSVYPDATIEHLVVEDSLSQMVERIRLSEDLGILFRVRNQLLLSGDFGSIVLQRTWFVDKTMYPGQSVLYELTRTASNGSGGDEELPLSRSPAEAGFPRELELVGLAEVRRDADGVGVAMVTYGSSGQALTLEQHYEPIDIDYADADEVRRLEHMGGRKVNLRKLGKTQEGAHLELGFPDAVLPLMESHGDAVVWLMSQVDEVSSEVERHVFGVYDSGLRVIHGSNQDDDSPQYNVLEYRLLESDPHFDHLAQ